MEGAAAAGAMGEVCWSAARADDAPLAGRRLGMYEVNSTVLVWLVVLGYAQGGIALWLMVVCGHVYRRVQRRRVVCDGTLAYGDQSAERTAEFVADTSGACLVRGGSVSCSWRTWHSVCI
jgi:hypothetical protein